MPASAGHGSFPSFVCELPSALFINDNDNDQLKLIEDFWHHLRVSKILVGQLSYSDNQRRVAG